MTYNPSMSPSPISATSQIPVRTYGPKSVLVITLFSLAVGGAFWFLYQRLDDQAEATRTTRDETDEIKSDFDVFRRETTSFKANLPQTHEAMRKRIEELEHVHEQMAKQLQTLRQEATSERIERDQDLARLAELRYLGREVRTNLDALKTELTHWRVRLASLMTDGEGKKIAADPAKVSLFVTATSGELVTDERVSAWEERIARQLRTVESVDLKTTEQIAVPDEFVEEIESLAADVRTALDRVRRQKASVEAILSETQDAEPGSETPALETALADHRNRAALAVQQAADAAAGRVAEDYAQKLAAEKEETQKQLGEATLALERQQREFESRLKQVEAQKIAEAAEAIRREEEARQAALKAELERERLEARFQAALPDIQRYLVPFITPGHKQLDGNKWVYSDEKGPLSLTGLRAKGALKNEQMSFQALYAVGGGQQNDRPDGMFPQYIGGHIHDPLVPLARKVQTLIEEFGDLLVEKGMLAP
jgi:hypothetical protein